jgi:fructose-bisphosphate aldolase class II
MPLASMLGELEKAQEKRYAVPSFNTFDMLSAQGIIAALEEKRAPGIVAIYTGVLDGPQAQVFTGLIREMAEEAAVPVSICLDHGASFEHCVKALSLGFTDVMYDGSQLPLEENIANTRMVVRAAHAAGAAVEAEVGHVGAGSTYQSFGAQGKGFTEPAAAERFVTETGVDCLAIAIGTAHGLFEGEPNLALDLLAEIRERVHVPLVMHGGSGLSDEQFRAAIAGGICKINVFTSLAVEATKRLADAAKGENTSYFGLTGQIREAFHDLCGWHLDVFGTTDQA